MDWPIETAGKRGYRTERANHLTEAARISLGETAWQVRSRVRNALLEHLLASRELALLRREIAIRREAVGIYEKRLAVGEASRPEVDTSRTALTLLQVSTQRAIGAEKETRAALVANIVIDYNSILLSGILTRYQAAGNQKVLELLKRISPVAWQHIHFLGHYTFRDKQHPIDLEAILASVNLQ